MEMDQTGTLRAVKDATPLEIAQHQALALSRIADALEVMVRQAEPVKHHHVASGEPF